MIDHVLKVSPAEQCRPILAHRFTLSEPLVFLCNRSEQGTIVEIAGLGDLHHRYERIAA
jgi:hypothetical protein